MMFALISRFELSYQMRNPVFWVGVVLFSLLAFATITVDGANIGGAGGNVHLNSPLVVIRTIIGMSIFFMFITTAFVANVVVRDDESGFGGIVRATGVRKYEYMLGRFVGAVSGAAVAFAAVPVALWLGFMMPWLDPSALGPMQIEPYLLGYFLFGLPNLLITAGIFFAVACATRSVTYSYVAVVVFLFAYIAVMTTIDARPELGGIARYLDVFGVRALDYEFRYATTAEINTLLPTWTWSLIINRLVWLEIAAMILTITIIRFRVAAPSAKKVNGKTERKALQAAAVQPVAGPLPAATPQQNILSVFWFRLSFELALLLRSPATWILLLAGLGSTYLSLSLLGYSDNVPSWPRTFALIENLMAGFSVMPIILVMYYSGEAVWRDREKRISDIIDATPTPNWAFIIPKTVAVAVTVILLLPVATFVEAVLFQLLYGVTDIQLGQWFKWMLAPVSAYLLLIASLAVVVQALSPSKIVGWAIMLIFMVVSVSAGVLGLEHPLLVFASDGRIAYSEMGGALNQQLDWWLKLYWAAVAVAVLVGGHLLWPRGINSSMVARLRLAGRSLRGTAGAMLAAATAVVVVVGGFLFYHMNVLNDYRMSNVEITNRTARYREDWLAGLEREYAGFVSLPQPEMTDVQLRLNLNPAAGHMEATGSYQFINRTDKPITSLHLRMFGYGATRLLEANVENATLEKNDETYQYRIYRFNGPLLPGQFGTLDFRTVRSSDPLQATGHDQRVVINGTTLRDTEMAPVIGMSTRGLITAKAERRRQKLEGDMRMAKLDAIFEQERNYFGADWVKTDITVTTPAEQIAVASGQRVSETVENGRRETRFVSNNPGLAFYSVQSAHYEVRRADADGVDLEVYYDPHHAVNVERIINALQASLSYYRSNFGPYQFPYARIVEFPGYATYAQAFGGVIAYSEKLGFTMDVRNPDTIDFVTYVTAHEIAHQYWAHQLVGADVQGATFLSETLSQYSALMVMRQLYGDAHIQRFLKFELNRYLTGRRGDKVEELPLTRVEDQPYIHYNKGSLAMYLLQDRLGEERINKMLGAMLAKYRFKGAPYARSTDLLEGLLSLARTPDERELVLDLIDRITLYDLKVNEASARQLPNGQFETTLTVQAGKFYADGVGVEKEAPLRDSIDIGIFLERPGTAAFSQEDVISLQRFEINSGEQTVRIVSTKLPLFVGIDPYIKYVDRNADDNVIAVTAEVPSGNGSGKGGNR